jgi:hypothetical protein
MNFVAAASFYGDFSQEKIESPPQMIYQGYHAIFVLVRIAFITKQKLINYQFLSNIELSQFITHIYNCYNIHYCIFKRNFIL